ncbi:methyltransferase domain-containing protein [Actinomadura oligospora]|uniref:methyltransferase domain-containing protein n=1 Tax=Actinomadura oligospora TaxID=111804 RepID=UPI00047B6EDB|nr:methyltransferase domain-containing protein [Actinomadura oligospora]
MTPDVFDDPGVCPARESLAGRLARSDGGSRWAQAVRDVPRHVFIPPKVWSADGDDRRGEFRLLDATDPAGRAEWIAAVHSSDTSLVTQLDGARRPAGRHGDLARGTPTGSATAPGLVAAMLHHLDPRDGMRVLHVGCGPGYTTGLLCRELGADQVVAVEVDEDLARRSRQSLTRLGHHPTLVVRDGWHGHRQGGPYDLVLVTASCRRPARAWIAQTRPGGRILLPLHGALVNSGLALLEVADGDTASGRFLPLRGSFMPLRDRRIRLTATDTHRLGGDRPRPVRRRTTTSPLPMPETLTGWYLVELTLHTMATVVAEADDGSGAFTAWFADSDTGSWARVDHMPGASTYAVAQSGPLLLWDEIEEILHWWERLGRPPWHLFGITVTPDAQYVWHAPTGETRQLSYLAGQATPGGDCSPGLKT